MAVTLTTKFYQSSLWKDLSKIVFTSPNMDSPNTAGTRSHILPGEGALGLWYEDTSNMYRIESTQSLTESDFYNYRMKNKISVNVDSEPSYIDVKEVNNGVFDTYIRETAGVAVEGYKDVTSSITNIATRLEYTPMQSNPDEIISKDETYVTEVTLNDSILCQLNYDKGAGETGCTYKTTVYAKQEKLRQHGWIAQVITGDTSCPIVFTFENPVKVAYVEMKSYAETVYDRTAACPTACTTTSPTINTTTTARQFFIGNFSIQAANTTVSGTTWTTLYTGANTSNTTKACYFTNTVAYKYYRLNILNNTGVIAPFTTTYYGVRYLRFYTYNYSVNPGSSNALLYDFSDENNNKVIEINNAYPVQSTTPTTPISTTYTDVTGTITMSNSSGHSYYEVKVRGTADQYDYYTTVSGHATTFSGVGTMAGYTFTKVDKQNILTLGNVEYPTISTIRATLYGDTTSTYENHYNVGTSAIALDTVVSGTVVSGTNMYTVTGITSREVSSTLYAKRDTYRLLTDDYITGSGTIDADTSLYVWGYDTTSRPLNLDTQNSIVFETTAGEAYSCRLTAWDDVTHSTTINELIAGDFVRISAMVYCSKTSKEAPSESQSPINYIFPPVHNKIIKGNVVDGETKYYYGDFSMVYRYQSDIYGDYLIFKPILYGINDSISYGVHDFIIALHYSYT